MFVFWDWILLVNQFYLSMETKFMIDVPRFVLSTHTHILNRKSRSHTIRGAPIHMLFFLSFTLNLLHCTYAESTLNKSPDDMKRPKSLDFIWFV